MNQMMKTDPIRVYLTVPYSEKEEAKISGARWDPVAKQWWIDRHDVAIHPTVYRWITDNEALASKAKQASEFTEVQLTVHTHPRKSKLPAACQQTDFSLPSCACLSAPWDCCGHTSLRGQGQPVATQVGS